MYHYKRPGILDPEQKLVLRAPSIIFALSACREDKTIIDFTTARVELKLIRKHNVNIMKQQKKKKSLKLFHRYSSIDLN